MAETLRDAFRLELQRAPSLDENGYICTKDEAIKAFDRAILASAFYHAMKQVERE